jgi:S-adenosylmethionine synthetase
MPLTLELSHLILQELSAIRRGGRKMKYLGPDSKAQVTIEYSDSHKPLRIDTIVVSTQHDDFVKPTDNTAESRKAADEKMLEIIRQDVIKHVIVNVKRKLPRKLKNLFKNDYKIFVNPTGKFVIGGPHGDTGLTGRKIIVDTYGGWGAHGGGAFSGKDPSKVDRSAAYAARHIAKNIVAADIATRCLIQIAYAIGIAEPVGVFVNTYKTAKVRNQKGLQLPDGEIAKKIKEVFDLRPYSIINRFGLKNPIYYPTASYGHVGRTPYPKKVTVFENGKEVQKTVEFFAWEKLDYVDKLRKAFGLN